MPKILEGIGCPYCGCSCDDIKVVVSDDGKKILEVENACAIGIGFPAVSPSTIFSRISGGTSAVTTAPTTVMTNAIGSRRFCLQTDPTAVRIS